MKKKLLALSLVMSMILSMTACNSAKTVNNTTPSSTPPSVASSEAEKPAESSEPSSEAPVEDAGITEEDVRAMMAALSEQLEKNPSVDMETYAVVGSDITKTLVMAFAQDKETELSYIKFAAPIAQMEVYAEKDGHLYVDMSAEVSGDEAAGAENADAVYFDGTKYHSLQKAEPKEGSNAEEITGELTESMDTPADGFDENTNFVIFDQKTDGDYTIVAIATKDEPDEDSFTEPKEQHMLLYVKDGVIEKFVMSAVADTNGLGTSLTAGESSEKTEAYMVARLGGDTPVKVPDYFDNIEYSDADEVGMTAAFGMMGIMFSMMGTTGEDGEEFVPAGEWAANAGALTIDEVEVIRELIDLDTEYLNEAADKAARENSLNSPELIALRKRPGRA